MMITATMAHVSCGIAATHASAAPGPQQQREKMDEVYAQVDVPWPVRGMRKGIRTVARQASGGLAAIQTVAARPKCGEDGIGRETGPLRLRPLDGATGA